jgi:hypothetical protein
VNPQDSQFDEEGINEQGELKPTLKESNVVKEDSPVANALGTLLGESTDTRRRAKEYDFPDKATRDARGALPPNPEYPEQKRQERAEARRAAKAAAAKASVEAAKNPTASKTSTTKGSRKKLRTVTLPSLDVLNSEMTEFYQSDKHDVPSEHCNNGCTVSNIDTKWRTCPAHSLLLNAM